jgi:hypothetical protein
MYALELPTFGFAFHWSTPSTVPSLGRRIKTRQQCLQGLGMVTDDPSGNQD